MKNKYLLLADATSPHILKWVKELVKYFDVYIISLNGADEKIYDHIEKNKIFILNENTIATGGNRKLIFKVFKIRKLIQEISPDYVNAHYLSSYGFLAALSKSASSNTILIQSTWGSDVLIEPFSSIIRKKAAQYSLNQAEYITSDSLHMSDIIGNLVEKKEVLTFSFGFNAIEKNNFKKEKIIFSNRALKDFYNIDKVLRWFAKQSNDYILVIANDGVERVNLEKLSKELSIENRVKFVGFIKAEEMKKYYQKSQYFISIPDSDGTAVSLLESMMYGCVPVVSNIPANREWILDLVNGVYFHENLMFEDISVEEDFDKINFKILQRKALFPKSIESFVAKVSK
ncbi:MAG: glycosyltransferase [Epsilonproteobacteria bacterium]|nr:glycosyltransferase [Campylobacterota bacterium]